MRCLLLFCGFFCATLALAGVEEDWQAVLALEGGPQAKPGSVQEAQRVVSSHLVLQEKALRNFLSKHPAEARSFEARLRLAHVLAVRGDIGSNAKATAESRRILNELERDPAASPENKADAVFLRISLSMRHINRGDESARDALLVRVRNFQKAYPSDRRVAGLLAEVATLYDSQPKRKQAMLEEALSLASDDELKQRIADDLKRIELLNKPLALNFTSLNGAAVNVEDYRGKIVLIYFFAGWSQPAMMALGGIRDTLSNYPASKVQPVGISLDKSKESLAEVVRTHKLDWPIYFDGKGWTSPLIRSLGINALPTVWILDTKGNLRTLNARDSADSVIRRLLREN